MKVLAIDCLTRFLPSWKGGKKGEPETGYTRYLLPPLPEVYDGSAKVRQEQEEIQNPSRAKIRERAAPRPLTINHRSSFKTASNPELLHYLDPKATQLVLLNWI